MYISFSFSFNSCEIILSFNKVLLVNVSLSFLVEIEQTKKNLRKYEKLLKEYYRRMYYGY